MGKKRSKKKGGAKPPDPRTLPFLQDMFPNIEKDIVEIVYEQNEYDQEKTIQQLTELGATDDSQQQSQKLYEDGDFDETVVDDFGNIELEASFSYKFDLSNHTTPNNHSNGFDTTKSKRHSPTTVPFISTHEHESNSTNRRHHSPPKATTFVPFDSPTKSYTAHTHTTTSTTISFTPSTSYTFSKISKPTSTNSISMANSTTGESGAFLSSMFPELDRTMVSLLYEENGCDIGKTVESLLSIVFMNHTGTGGDEEEEEADALDDIESDALAGVAESEEESSIEFDQESDPLFDTDDADNDEEEDEVEEEEESDGEENGYIEEDNGVYRFDAGEFKFEIPQPPAEEDLNGSVSVASKSEFIQNLKLLAELFPETPRTLLALELDEHDGNLEKTIASCCRADPEYLKKLSGEKPSDQVEEVPQEERPRYPAPNLSTVKPTWIRKGPSTPSIKYVPPRKTKTKSTTTTTTSRKPAKSTLKSLSRAKPRPMDLAAKLKLKQLREKFSFVDADILEAVFVQSAHKVHATLVCLYDIYPHLRDASGAQTPAHASEKPLTRAESPEIPLSRKRATPQTTPQTQGEKPRKAKRKEKPVSEEEEEFITVSYRKKKAEGNGNGSSSTVTPKKVMDSDDIEISYQSYREQAIKAGEMRNLLFMQAAAAYQSGNGAQAKALSQRARDYDEKMKGAHNQACHQIFIDCNARFDTLASVDLHGLHVAEALQVLSQLLDIHTQMGETNRKPKKLRVITGVGKHSLHGVAKIKPAVKNFLRSKGYSFAETEAGVITIALSRH